MHAVKCSSVVAQSQFPTLLNSEHVKRKPSYLPFHQPCIHPTVLVSGLN